MWILRLTIRGRRTDNGIWHFLATGLAEAAEAVMAILEPIWNEKRETARVRVRRARMPLLTTWPSVCGDRRERG